MQPHLKKQWCIGQIDALFLAAMERVLNLYSEAYQEEFPVVCYDERPCFLIGDTALEIPMKTGKVAKHHYSYTKHGSCSILAAIEPKTGRRLAQVKQHRTKREFAYFMAELAKQYPKAKKIRVVLDNLNTHHFGAFYEYFRADEADRLAQLFDFVYTPKSASWLNMIEIEFSALSRQCLARRIPCQDELEKQTQLFFKERMEKKIQIQWQFSVTQARQKLNRHYVKVNSENQVFKVT